MTATKGSSSSRTWRSRSVWISACLPATRAARSAGTGGSTRPAAGPTAAREKEWVTALEAIRDAVDPGSFGDMLAVAVRHAPVLNELG